MDEVGNFFDSLIFSVHAVCFDWRGRSLTVYLTSIMSKMSFSQKHLCTTRDNVEFLQRTKTLICVYSITAVMIQNTIYFIAYAPKHIVSCHDGKLQSPPPSIQRCSFSSQGKYILASGLTSLKYPATGKQHLFSSVLTTLTPFLLLTTCCFFSPPALLH